ncbi:heparan-alpha-glucosaminide N-acetyltransferase [Paraglaciecola sp.]|uniref:heparan-alpha-glucosaminide N-acetyltransferase n=1 Tax=Paraglaciecola sp. TaxID=1920173 RepID=UPI0030F40931
MRLAGLSKSHNFQSRSLTVDVLRGTSILLMIVFHFAYDLTVFGYAHYDTNIDIEWRIFRVVIVSGFLLAVGMSSYLAYQQHINKQKLTKNLLKLFMVSALISISSYMMYPNNWVYFGIIHFVTVALPLSLLFIHRPNFSLIVAMIIILGYFTGTLTLEHPWVWSVKHLGIPVHTADLVSVLPWFALVLMGIFIIHHQLLPKIKANNLSLFLARLGQHSLVIYLLHQPVLFTGFYLVQHLAE